VNKCCGKVFFNGKEYNKIVNNNNNNCGKCLYVLVMDFLRNILNKIYHKWFSICSFNSITILE
jgi:hypothetical protein